MRKLIRKYEQKLVKHELCEPEEILIGGMDDVLIWNKYSKNNEILEPCFNNLNLNSIIFAKPKEPFFSIINYLAKKNINNGEFCPDDTETRTFLHTIPVSDIFNSNTIIENLKKRKCLYVIDKGIICYGIVSPEQAFIVFSSVCFASFVKFFVDYYLDNKLNITTDNQKIILNNSINYYSELLLSLKSEFTLMKGPFYNDETIIKAMSEAGKKLIENKMVDSFFGNISYRFDKYIFISQTGSSMDELPGYIDKVSIDGSNTTGITASSEYSSHRTVLTKKNYTCILHGHPKFSVIISMICDKENCKNRGFCYKNCKENRFIEGIPIISGEVGTGVTGLSNTLPEALIDNNTAIVYGHGLFAYGNDDFQQCFRNLINIEKICFKQFQKLI